VLDASLRAQERWGSANLVGVVTILLRTGVTMGCLWLGYQLVGMGYATIIVTLATLMLAAIVFRKVSRGIRLGLSMFSWSHLREMLSFGLLTTVTTLAYSLTLPGHRLIIGKLVSLEAVAVYTVAATLIERLRQAVWSPFQVSWPRFALLHGEQDHQGLCSLFERGTRYCSQLSSFLVLMTALFGPPFIRLWVGPGFEEAERILLIMCLGVLVESCAFLSGSFLGGTGRQHAQSAFALVEGTLGLGLSLGLGWRRGMTGVAWGYTIAVIVVRGMAMTFYVCRLLHLNPVTYLGRAFMGSWFFAGAVVCLGYALHLPTRIHSWPSLMAASAVGLVATAAGMYVFVMTTEEREKALYWIRRLRPLVA